MRSQVQTPLLCEAVYSLTLMLSTTNTNHALTTLEHNDLWLVDLHHLAHDGLEQLLIRLIINAVVQGNVHGVAAPSAGQAALLSCGMCFKRQCGANPTGQGARVKAIVQVDIYGRAVPPAEQSSIYFSCRKLE